MFADGAGSTAEFGCDLFVGRPAWLFVVAEFVRDFENLPLSLRQRTAAMDTLLERSDSTSSAPASAVSGVCISGTAICART